MSLVSLTERFQLTEQWLESVLLVWWCCKSYTVTIVVLMLLLVVALVSELWGETVARRWSLVWGQLRAQSGHSWHDAQKELQQGSRRHTLTLHRHQPGDQQHQHSSAEPTRSPRATYQARGDTYFRESGGQIDKQAIQPVRESMY